MSWSKLNFRPDKEGFKKILGELESEVMEILWKLGEASVREVFEELSKKREIAYTTALSTMRNLEHKELLRRSKQGAGHVYRPTYTQEELSRRAVDEVVSGLVDGFGQAFVASLIDLNRDKNLADTIKRLEKSLIEQEEANKKK